MVDSIRFADLAKRDVVDSIRFAEMVLLVVVWSDLVWFGFGLVWFGLVWFGLVWSGFGCYVPLLRVLNMCF